MTTSKNNGAYDTLISLRDKLTRLNGVITPEAVDKFEADLKAAGKKPELYRYDAEHGFVNEQRPDAHDRAHCELAWERTLGFWKQHLG